MVQNPGTGATITEVPTATTAEVEAAIARARAAQPAWGALSFARARARAAPPHPPHALGRPELLDTLVAESGKPHYEAEAMELFYTCELTRYYTGRAGRRALRDDVRHPLVFANKRARVVYHPRGVVGVIGPWNWPLLNNFADCVAPLACGNAVVLKPSEWTPLTSLRVQALWRELGLPENVFQVVTGKGDVGQELCKQVDMIFFTGSQKVGRQIARDAGERLIPVVLELGGKSPMLVLADADLPRAAHAAVWSGFAHSGQVCIRTERVFVEEPVAARFVELCAAEVAKLRQGPAPPPHGDRSDVDFDVGAMTFAPQVDNARAQIADAVAKGARVVAGGASRTDLPGRFFAPTLIADATPEMAVMREETFGPVLPDHARARRRDRAAPGQRFADGPVGQRLVARRGARAGDRAPPGVGQRLRERRAGELLLRRGAARRRQGERHGLPPRPRGAAPVLPHRDRRRGPRRCWACSRRSSTAS